MDSLEKQWERAVMFMEEMEKLKYSFPSVKWAKRYLEDLEELDIIKRDNIIIEEDYD